MSRNGNGDYTLPLNDVETGTTISSVWANTTMEDIATALTNSLSRNANGGMNAPLRHSDGTVNAPSLSFNTETNTGIYRVTTGEYRFCVNGKDKLRVIDVDGMPGVQVYSNIAPIGWQTLGKASDIAGLTLQKVLQQGDRALGENIVMGAGSAGPTNYLSTIAFDGVDSENAKAHMWYENNALRVLSGESLVFTTDTAGINSNILINSAGLVNIEQTNGFTVTNPNNGANLGVTAGSSTILISPGSGSFPTPQALFTESANIQLLTDVDVTGTVTPQAIDFGVDQKLKFSSDANNYLQIYRGANGTSYIQEVGSGALHIRGEVTTIRNDANQVMLAADSGVVSLWAFGVQRFQTGGGGVSVTGVVDCDALRLGNDQKITIGQGAGGKLEIYETAAGTALIVQDGPGDLVIKGQNILLKNNNDQTLLQTIQNKIQLFYQNGINQDLKLETADTGIDVTGTVDLDNLTISADQGTVGQVLTSTGSGIEWAAGGGGGGGTLAETLALGNDTGFNDINVTGAQKITFGSTNDLQIYNSGSNSLISETGSGDLFIGSSNALRLQVGSVDVLVATSAGVQSSPTMALRSTSIIDQDLINYFGMRLLNNATTVTTYAIPQVSIAQVGKTVVICNPTNKTITLDADGGTGTVAQYVWILDGVTLMARNGDWQIKAGGVIELVQVGSDIAGGSQTAPNWVIFGAGILAI